VRLFEPLLFVSGFVAAVVLPGFGGNGNEVGSMPSVVYLPKTVETVVERPPETIVVERVVEKPVEKVVVQPGKPAPLKEFASLEELKKWCDKNVALIIVLRAEGPTDLINPGTCVKTDCDDYAERLQRRAVNDGYIMSQQLVQDGKIFGVPVTDINGYHVGNLTVVGNDVYFIEPQPYSFQIVRVCSRD
jgi:hypothetical protein